MSTHNFGQGNKSWNQMSKSEKLQRSTIFQKADVDKLKRGGHDFKKLYAAFSAAVKTKGKPTVILAKTKKGYGMGKAGESKMTNHQQKELNLDALKEFRDRFQLDIPDNKIENLEFYKPSDDSDEIKYLKIVLYLLLLTVKMNKQ